jgi:hypothetical protein
MTKLKDLVKDDVFEWNDRKYIFVSASVMDKKKVAVCWNIECGLSMTIPCNVEVEKIGTLSRMIQNAKVNDNKQ